MASRAYAAVDLGASSGRVLAGLFDGERVRLQEAHRFDNGGVAIGPRLYWDVLALWRQVLQGLRAVAAEHAGSVRSVGVDTWGVDFALLGRGDELLANPRHYRDRHTDGILQRAFAQVPREELFRETGLQFMQFNSLYQLLALKEANSAVLEAAESFLMMPDLFHWLLTGRKSNEATNASTTQFYNPHTRDWAKGLLARFGLPAHILGELSPPGTRLGPLAAGVAEETGLTNVDCVLPGTHDTASAVVAAPAAADASWCYISSGTWSLMGVESPHPVTSDLCRQLNFTNEGGVGGTTRLLKNITGLWLLQECRRKWAQSGRDLGWEELNRLADAAPPRTALIDPDDAAFMAPADMPAAIRDYCQRTGQTAPADEGGVIRCALDSLALKCRLVLTWLEQLVNHRIEVIHIVGGGVQNKLLCQATADACGRPVLAGPVEATALGNVMVQVQADGGVANIAEAREVIRRSFALEHYVPRETAAWDEAFGRFQSLMQRR